MDKAEAKQQANGGGTFMISTKHLCTNGRSTFRITTLMFYVLKKRWKRYFHDFYMTVLSKMEG